MSNRVLLSASAVINAAPGVLRQMTEPRRGSAGSAAAGAFFMIHGVVDRRMERLPWPSIGRAPLGIGLDTCERPGRRYSPTHLPAIE